MEPTKAMRMKFLDQGNNESLFGSFELKTDRFRVRRVINCTTRSSTEYKLKCCQLFRRVAVVVFQYETIDNFRTTQDKSSTNDVTLRFVVYAILQ